MFVSFVVATYNCVDRVAILRETAHRLRDLPCEICISDGGSTDGTLEAVEGIRHARVVRSGRDRGIYDAWNLGMDGCTGEYLAFIGVDDEPSVDFISAAMRHCEAGHPPPGFIYGDAELRNGRRFRTVASPLHPSLFGTDRPRFDVPHPGSLSHRSLFETERFDPSYRLAGDLHFYLRARGAIRERGYLKLPDVQAVVEANGVSRSSSAFRLYRAEYARIERELGVELGYSSARLHTMALLFERAPSLFRAARFASWQLRGRAHG